MSRRHKTRPGVRALRGPAAIASAACAGAALMVAAAAGEGHGAHAARDCVCESVTAGPRTAALWGKL